MRALFLSLVLVSLSSVAGAQATLINGFGGTTGYGTECLSRNDDGSSASIDITSVFPRGLRFFSDTHTSMFVNTNGNITFSARLSTFTPRAFPVAAQPMIAPYWGDVDIRQQGGSCAGFSVGTTCTVCSPCHNPSENGVWWELDPAGRRIIVTWDRVGYYNCNNELRMSFQLILTAVDGCGGEGDFDVEFRYNRCEWETGDASGGSGGFGGTPAQAGFDAGDSTNFVAIEGSRMAGIARHLCMNSNVGETGIWRFQVRGGTVMCPDAGMECDAGGMGVCAEGRTNCVGMGTECQAVLEPSGERCDALDNDCDGSTDEGDGLCPGTEICNMGVCQDVCFEGGCGAGETCDAATGRCVDSACIDVECAEGERCEGGVCVGACDGVTCPRGQECRGGRCLDLCESLTCDPECQVCSEGACVGRCDLSGCPDGETCTASGHCVEDACAAITCGAGEVCEGGACVDACTGAMCPDGQVCTAGECVAAPMGEDAGPGGTDGGPGGGDDAGGPVIGEDAGDPPGVDSGTDGGRIVPGGPADPGCACRTTGGGDVSALLLLALALPWWRRRRG